MIYHSRHFLYQSDNTMRLKTFYLLSSITLSVYTQEPLTFKNPPQEFGTYAWWHWAGSNFSKEGITKDLEAMKSTRIGGATIFNITSAVQESQAPTLNNPWPEQEYRSGAYWEAIEHAVKEAKRLGLELGLHNTVGYSTTGGPWITEELGMQCTVITKKIVEGGKEIQVLLEQGVPPIYRGWGSFKKETTLYKDIAVIAVPQSSDNISADKAINLTKYLKADGNLVWNAPKGIWNIFRIGYAPTMANPHPVPDELMGKVLEVDKISSDANKFHWEQVLKPLKTRFGDELGKTFKHILIDSYEAGKQDWTDGFEKEFIKIKGYDPLPWLTGMVGTEKERKRFEFDYKDVIAQLYYEKGFGIGAEMIHKYKMELQFEPYSGPFNTLDCTSLADVPMGEFWTHSSGGINQNVVSSARAEGKRIIAAEAFTSRPERSAWTEDPNFLKYSADGAFCSGVNRLVLHHWVHQPFDDRYQPGLSMGWWGTHFNRYQTWFEPGKAFFTYLSRIQYMLQQGEEVIEYLCLDKAIGHSDAISSDRFLKAKIKVRNGKLILPSGRVYNFLVCPNLKSITPEMADKLLSLSQKGLAIVGDRPEESPSLKGYPECDDKVRGIGKRLKLYSSIDEARKALNLTPSLISHISTDSVKTVLRNNGDKVFVFVANRTSGELLFDIEVKANNLMPEIWNPETGSIVIASSWEIKENGYTRVSMNMQPNETQFVVFRNSPTIEQITAGSSPISQLKANGAIKLRGEWEVDFHPKMEKDFSATFHQLADFKYNTDKRIMYFSGTAIYHKVFHLSEEFVDSKKIYLSLGEMHDIACVKINGNDTGIWWYAPYRKDITKYLKAGNNEIEIEVTTNWANRLIGDEQEPADFEWGTDRGPSRGRAMKAYPEWFINNTQRPSERKAFVIWYYHTQDSELQSAGLCGPVKFEAFN